MTGDCSLLPVFGRHVLQLIPQCQKKSIDEGYAAAELRLTEFAEQREEFRRLDDWFALAAERLARGHGHTLKQVRVDGAEHLANDQHVAQCARRQIA